METTYTQRIQVHKTNKLEGMHPSAKFLVVLLYTLCAFVLRTFKFTHLDLPLLLAAWFLVVPALCAASGVFGRCAVAFKPAALLAAVIFLAQTFLVPGGRVLWRLGFIKIREGGVRSAVSLSFTVMDVAGIFIWLFRTTENKEIARALEEAGLSHKAVYVFTSALRMTDTLKDKIKTVMDAQKARGVETEGGPVVRARAFLPSLIPVVLSSVTDAEEKVMTLEARGFSAKCERTHLFNLERSGIERRAESVSIIITVLIIAARTALWLL